MTAPYPWLTEQWQHLNARLAEDRLGHAYLLSGREGLGKLALAEAFAGAALCEADAAALRPCGECRACVLTAAGNHPDLKLLAPEEERTAILIDQVRELIEYYSLKSHYGRRKVSIVCPADAMNHAAANALLKILEEPPAGALLLLVAHRPGLLPATIVSRCQRITLHPPAWRDVERWLVARNPRGADLEGLTLAGGPLAIAAQLEAGETGLLDQVIGTLLALARGEIDVLEATRNAHGTDAGRFVDTLEIAVQAMISLAAGNGTPHIRVPPARLKDLQETSDKLNSRQLFRFLDRVCEARRLLLRSSGVRSSEVIESLWFNWVGAARAENMP